MNKNSAGYSQSELCPALYHKHLKEMIASRIIHFVEIAIADYFSFFWIIIWCANVRRLVFMTSLWFFHDLFTLFSIVVGYNWDSCSQAKIPLEQWGHVKEWFVICSWCKKKVRKLDETTWQSIETISQDRLKKASMSHGICPTCRARFRSDAGISDQSKNWDITPDYPATCCNKIALDIISQNYVQRCTINT